MSKNIWITHTHQRPHQFLLSYTWMIHILKELLPGSCMHLGLWPQAPPYNWHFSIFQLGSEEQDPDWENLCLKEEGKSRRVSAAGSMADTSQPHPRPRCQSSEEGRVGQEEVWLPGPFQWTSLQLSRSQWSRIVREVSLHLRNMQPSSHGPSFQEQWRDPAAPFTALHCRFSKLWWQPQPPGNLCEWSLPCLKCFLFPSVILPTFFLMTSKSSSNFQLP